jgi:hypothetical protein
MKYYMDLIKFLAFEYISYLQILGFLNVAKIWALAALKLRLSLEALEDEAPRFHRSAGKYLHNAQRRIPGECNSQFQINSQRGSAELARRVWDANNTARCREWSATSARLENHRCQTNDSCTLLQL